MYLDVSKDKLYIGEENDIKRRACQTVVSALVERLIAAIAPLTPHMAEEAFQSLPYDKPNDAISVFIAGWPSNPDAWSSLNGEEVQFWDSFLEIRDTVNKVLEDSRNAKLLGAPLEAKVKVHCSDADFTAKLAREEISNDLRYLFIVSGVEIVDSSDEAVNGCDFTSVVDVPAPALSPSASPAPRATSALDAGTSPRSSAPTPSTHSSASDASPSSTPRTRIWSFRSP